MNPTQAEMQEVTADEQQLESAASFGRDSLRLAGVGMGFGPSSLLTPARPLSKEEKLALAGSPLADEGTWFKLVKEGDPELQVAIARNPKASLNVLELLARTGCEEAQVAVAAHPQISASLLGILAGSPNARVAEAVAAHPKTPVALLEQLATSFNAGVRAAALRHPRLSAETIADALSGDLESRLMISRNPSLTREQVAFLAECGSPQIAVSLLRHPKLDATLFQRCLQRGDEAFLLASMRHRFMTVDALNGIIERQPPLAVKEAVMRSPRVSPAMLARLGQDHEPAVRKAVAGHPMTPATTLLSLVHDADETVAMGLLAHPQLPYAVIDAIVRGESVNLKVGLARRPNLPEDVLIQLLRTRSLRLHQTILRLPRPSLRLMSFLARSAFIEVRYDLIQLPYLPASVAEDMVRDPAWCIREAAIRTGKLSDAALLGLAHDPVKWVRLTAQGKAPRWPWEHGAREADFEACFQRP